MSIFFCILCLLSFIPVSSAQEKITYSWPIDAPKFISSSFGEYRPGRFHLGLDFKSGGAVGKKVYSLDDGYIYNIRTTPFGYGKSLYIALDNGKMVVYGHLSGFTPEIEDSLRVIRIRNGSYDVNWLPEKNRFRVAKGELVAYSGASGSGPAHLHLEIRDANNVAENPLKYGFEVRDTTPPALSRVAIIPLDKDARVDGLPKARWFGAAERPASPVVLSGNCGIAVSAIDQADEAYNRIGVYTLSLTIDSKEIFTKVYDGISYENQYYGAFDYMPGHHFGGGGLLSPVYRQQGNILTNYHGEGILNAAVCEPGKTCTATIRATDFFGNECSVSFPVVYLNRPFITACERSERGGLHIAGRHLGGTVKAATISRAEQNGSMKTISTLEIGSDVFDIKPDIQGAGVYRVVLEAEDGTHSMPVTIAIRPQGSGGASIALDTELNHDHMLVRMSSKQALGSLPILRVFRDGEADSGVICPVQESDRSWMATVPITGHGEHYFYIEAHAVAADGSPVRGTVERRFFSSDNRSELTIQSPDGLLTVKVAPNALYRPAPITFSSYAPKAADALSPVSKIYQINCGDYPVCGPVEVRLSSPEAFPPKSALFTTAHANGTGGWRFLTATPDGATFTGKMTGFGAVAVMTDSSIPYCAAASPQPGTSIKNSRPVIVARLSDTGSGLQGSDSITMTIDGERVYGEYDNEAARVSYRPYNPLAPGKHTVDVTVTDRVGNVNAVSWSFTVVR